MAQVIFVSSICDPYTQGLEKLQVAAANVFQLVDALERRFPGIGRFIEAHASIAVDGEAVHTWTRPLTPDSEVILFPKIAGG